MLCDSRIYKSDDCWRSAKVDGTCKPGILVCLRTEIIAIVVVERDTIRLGIQKQILGLVVSSRKYESFIFQKA